MRLKTLLSSLKANDYFSGTETSTKVYKVWSIDKNRFGAIESYIVSEMDGKKIVKQWRFSPDMTVYKIFSS